MEWSLELIGELNQVVSYLKRNPIGKMLEHSANYFITKHEIISNYSMNFSKDVVDVSIVGEGEYRLALICEIIRKKTGKFKNVYNCLSYMLRYSLKKKFKYPASKPDHKTSYLISLLKDTIKDSLRDPLRDSLRGPLRGPLKTDEKGIEFAIKTTKKLIGKDINGLVSTISQTQNLDLTILSDLANRSVLEILKTRRTLYVRILLVLTYEIRGISNIKEWGLSKLDFSSLNGMIAALTSPVIETVIFLSSC